MIQIDLVFFVFPFPRSKDDDIENTMIGPGSDKNETERNNEKHNYFMVREGMEGS